MSPRKHTLDPSAPTRLCCGMRHYGAVCPDGKVMCCICFNRFDAAGLNPREDGKREDVCAECARLER